VTRQTLFRFLYNIVFSDFAKREIVEVVVDSEQSFNIMIEIKKILKKRVFNHKC